MLYSFRSHTFAARSPLSGIGQCIVCGPGGIQPNVCPPKFVTHFQHTSHACKLGIDLTRKISVSGLRNKRDRSGSASNRQSRYFDRCFNKSSNDRASNCLRLRCFCARNSMRVVPRDSLGVEDLAECYGVAFSGVTACFPGEVRSSIYKKHLRRNGRPEKKVNGDCSDKRDMRNNEIKGRTYPQRGKIKYQKYLTSVADCAFWQPNACQHIRQNCSVVSLSIERSCSLRSPRNVAMSRGDSSELS